MTQHTRWFEYGQPVENDRVEATIRTVYETGPNEDPKADDVRQGTVAAEALSLLGSHEEIVEHTHDDGSILLSALSDEAEDRLLETFEEDGFSRLQAVMQQGCTPAEAVDYLMTEERGLSQTIWAERRGADQSTVSENVAKAREKVDSPR